EPETQTTQPEPSTPAEPVTPEVLHPAPDIAQPVPEPTLPEGESEITPTPTIDSQKATEQLETSEKIITAITITSPYLPAPEEFILDKEEITLGHAGDSDILLDKDQTTSRHHAMLKRKGDQYFAYDLLSDQGVIVNGQKLTPGTGFPLTDGDCLYICSYTL